MTTALYTRILGESKRMVFTYSFLKTTKCASSFGHPILNIFWRCSIVRDDASEVCEFLYHFSGVHQCGYWELCTETSALVDGLLLSSFF